MLKSFSPRSAVEITPAIPGMEPQGTYLVDILSALSGVNMKQEFQRGQERGGLLTGDTGEADKAQAVDIASRLANIYYTNGAYVDARAMRNALERMQAAA